MLYVDYNFDINDNIIILNYGESGSGVTLGISGIEIDRGILNDAQVVWNEGSLEWVFYREKAPSNTLSQIHAGALKLLNGNTIDYLDNDSTLAGNSTTSLPTQYAVKTYVDNLVSLNLFYQTPILNFYDPTSGLPTSPNNGDRYISLASSNG